MTYTRIRRLGNGEFGVVYLERDESLGRLCAAKVMSERAVAGTLIDEAALMHMTRHPHVAEVYSAEVEDGFPTVRMEYLEAGSVHDFAKGLPIDVSTAIHFGADAARGLHHLHSNGIVHRDVKASNLLLADNRRVKVSDFGLAGPVGNSSDFTIAYMPHLAPEEIANGLQGSTLADEYALGVTLYRLLNGDAIFWENVSSSALHSPRLLNWLPHIHGQLRKVVSRATHQNPERRYQSINDFRLALEASTPVVSWRLEPIAQGLRWFGLRDGSPAWRVDLSNEGAVHIRTFRLNQHGRETRVVTATKALRSIGAAYGFAVELMESITTTGRP